MILMCYVNVVETVVPLENIDSRRLRHEKSSSHGWAMHIASAGSVL